MGGNALTGIRHTRRFAADEYHKLVPDVVARVQSIVGPHNRVTAIPTYRTKESFGDMDVAVELTRGTAYEFRQGLARAFGIDYLVSDGTSSNHLDLPEDAPVTVRTASDLAQSGKTYSFAFNELQIDILPMTPENFAPSVAYYSFSDCGNLLGRVTHAFGLKLGHLGLAYPFKHFDHEFTELVVEREWSAILPAFGWNYETWANGFDTIEDVFRFVASTPFFHADIFQFHNRNAKSRVRDRKRTTYNGFLSWLEAQPVGSLPTYQFANDKADYLPMLFERLQASGFKQKYEATAAAFKNWNDARERFNGEFVRQLTGLNGKPLANLMTTLRQAMGSSAQEIQAWVLAHSKDELEKLVLQRHSCQPTECSKGT